MKISTAQIKLFAKLLSKEEKQEVAKQAKMGYTSLESLIYGHRHNRTLAEKLYQAGCKKLEQILEEKERIDFINSGPLNEESYKIQKESITWKTSENYLHYMDIYLQLSHLDLKEPIEVLDLLTTRFRNFLGNHYYCVDLIVRLTGCEPKQAIKLFGDEQKKQHF